MTTEYELGTIKDIFDKVPTERVDVCLSELGEGIKRAQGMRDALEEVAGVVTGDRGNAQAFWPETCTWTDDDKGEITIHATIELQGQTT